MFCLVIARNSYWAGSMIPVDSKQKDTRSIRMLGEA